MIIDGSYGEGGGQILRTSTALSAISGKSVVIENIRKERLKPGLSQQHIKAVELLAKICDAHVSGCSTGSTRLEFVPGKIRSGEYKTDIGTAGSIPLLLQCIMPVLAHAPGTVSLTITGGTDVRWSPSVDYLRFVTIRALKTMGYECDLKLIRRGYYPRGDGYVEAVFKPSNLKYAEFNENDCSLIEGISHSSGLPSHVAARQADSAMRFLSEQGYSSNILAQVDNYPSTGSGITLWCGNMGSIALGKPGLRAEKVGVQAGKVLLDELRSHAGVDEYLADQLIPYIAFAGGGSLTTRNISMHTKTNIWVIEQFLPVKFNIVKLKTGLFRIWL